MTPAEQHKGGARGDGEEKYECHGRSPPAVSITELCRLLSDFLPESLGISIHRQIVANIAALANLLLAFIR